MDLSRMATDLPRPDIQVVTEGTDTTSGKVKVTVTQPGGAAREYGSSENNEAGRTREVIRQIFEDHRTIESIRRK